MAADADLNTVHAEQLVATPVLIVGAMAWLLSDHTGFGGAAVVVSYLGVFFGVRAWRLRRAT